MVLTDVHDGRVQYRSATTVGPVGRRWIRLTLGVLARGLREDRILDEAHATGGDVRRLVDLFGLGVNAASRYTATVDHPDLSELTYRPGRRFRGPARFPMPS